MNKDPNIGTTHSHDSSPKELDGMLSSLSGIPFPTPISNVTVGSNSGQMGVSFGSSQPVYFATLSHNVCEVMAMQALKDQSVKKTLDNLQKRQEGSWTLHDDHIFESHTLLVAKCIELNIPSLAIDAWQQHLRPAIALCEAELGKAGSQARLHKGAILHNVAVCHLIAGDLDSAFQLFSAAGQEDQLLGRGNWTNVVLGQHPLTERKLIDPVIAFSNSNSDWARTYSDTLSRSLDSCELKSLLVWLATKEEDAVQLLHSLHRFLMSSENFPSPVQPHIQVRSIADLILVIESSLRRWQSGVTGQLHNRMEAFLTTGTNARNAFDDAHRAYCAQFPSGHPDRETEVGINWAINDCLSRTRSETSVARRAGIAAYLSVRLRNSLMHVILGNVSLYQNEAERWEVAGLMLAALGLSKAAEQGTIPMT